MNELATNRIVQIYGHF